MKRKLISILTIITLFALTAIPAFGETNYNTEVERYTDGSYAIIETQIVDNAGISLYAASTKTASRTYQYYNAENKKAWDFTLKATFSYDGSTSKATAASTSYNTYVTGWTCASRSATKSGATATGKATFKYKTLTKNISIGLKCSSSGTISAA